VTDQESERIELPGRWKPARTVTDKTVTDKM